MRIIQVCSSKGQLRGGAEQFCLNLSKSLTVADHDITFVTGNRPGPIVVRLPFMCLTIPEAQNILLRKLGLDYINPSAIRYFRTIVDYIKPDVIHFHSFYGLSTSLVKVVTQNYPVVVTLHDNWVAFVDGSLVRPKFGLANSYLKIPMGYIHRIMNKSLLKDSTLVSPSTWMANYYESAGFKSPTHIPNGIEITTDCTRYENTILWVGALTTFKGLPGVIDTLSEISIRSGWRFIVIGDGPHKLYLQSKYPNVQFLGYCDPKPYYSVASLLVVSSIGPENFPTVVLEGMRHGLCVVGRDMAGYAELIRHNQTGVLFNSTSSLNELLSSLIAKPERIRDIGNSAKKVFNQNYRLDICLGRYMNLYHTVISSRSNGFTNVVQNIPTELT